MRLTIHTSGLLKSAVMSKFEPVSDSELSNFHVKDCWLCNTPSHKGRRFLSQSQPIPMTREGFRLETDSFTLPKDTVTFDPKTKRAITICNLFVNYELPLRDIVRLLDEDNEKVIVTLLEQGIVQDRRVNTNETPERQERRKRASYGPESRLITY